MSQQNGQNYLLHIKFPDSLSYDNKNPVSYDYGHTIPYPGPYHTILNVIGEVLLFNKNSEMSIYSSMKDSQCRYELCIICHKRVGENGAKCIASTDLQFKIYVVFQWVCLLIVTAHVTWHSA